MGQRHYLRGLTQLSKPLAASVGLGALAAVTWLVAVVLQEVWEVDVGAAGPLLGALMIGAVISAGAELIGHRSRWVRAIGGVLIAAAVVAVVLVALVVWYASELCGNGCN